MNVICLRGVLPRGVTKLCVARLFLRGRSVGSLAFEFRCEQFVIEDAIRAVIRRQEKR